MQSHCWRIDCFLAVYCCTCVCCCHLIVCEPVTQLILIWSTRLLILLQYTQPVLLIIWHSLALRWRLDNSPCCSGSFPCAFNGSYTYKICCKYSRRFPCSRVVATLTSCFGSTYNGPPPLYPPSPPLPSWAQDHHCLTVVIECNTEHGIRDTSCVPSWCCLCVRWSCVHIPGETVRLNGK